MMENSSFVIAGSILHPVYQLATLRMLEFYYDLLHKYVDCRDFESIYMDTKCISQSLV